MEYMDLHTIRILQTERRINTDVILQVRELKPPTTPDDPMHQGRNGHCHIFEYLNPFVILK